MEYKKKLDPVKSDSLTYQSLKLISITSSVVGVLLLFVFFLDCFKYVEFKIIESPMSTLIAFGVSYILYLYGNFSVDINVRNDDKLFWFFGNVVSLSAFFVIIFGYFLLIPLMLH